MVHSVQAAVTVLFACLPNLYHLEPCKSRSQAALSRAREPWKPSSNPENDGHPVGAQAGRSWRCVVSASWFLDSSVGFVEHSWAVEVQVLSSRTACPTKAMQS